MRNRFRKAKEVLKRVFSFRRRFLQTSAPLWTILICLTLTLAFLLSHKPLTRMKQYHPGDIAESNIKAHASFPAKDTESTRILREEASESIPPVFDFDHQTYRRIAARLEAAFTSLRRMYEPAEGAENPGGRLEEQSLNEGLAEWNKVVGMDLPMESFQVMERSRFSEDLHGLILNLLEPVFRQGIVVNKQAMYSNPDVGITVRSVRSDSEEHVTDFDRFLSVSEAREAIRARASDFMREYKYPSLMLAIRVAQDLVTANLTLNKAEWERRKEEAALAVKPVYYQVAKNEMIVREGEKLSQRQVDELAAMAELQRKEHQWFRFLGLALILGIVFFVTSETAGQLNRRIRLSNKDFLFFAVVLLVCFLIALPAGYLSYLDPDVFVFPLSSTLYSTPITIGPMIISIFFGTPLALMFSVVTALVAALVLQNSVYFFMYFLVGGFIAAISVQDCRDRSVLTKAGLLVGLTNIFLVVAINMITDHLLTQAALFDMLFALLGGAMAGIIVTGLIPLGEMAFGYTTNIKLLELANLDSTVLKELMIVAPGTYHHSLVVGTMVEAAARTIGANSLLCKVAAYYHDLGKIRKPDYFIENQEGRNRHEKLAPSMSSLILISHVKEGVELARKHRLGDAIVDIIQQHHGKNLITYFYQKAKDMKGSDQGLPEEADFRYPGPKPQTKEAGLVLLADGVEAASRTLQGYSPARIQGLVQKMINKAFSDGQLDECELTLKDLHQIAKSFNQILTGIYHQRIQYPEPADKGAAAPKAKNGSTAKQPAKPAGDRPAEAEVQDHDNLKRLGL